MHLCYAPKAWVPLPLGYRYMICDVTAHGGVWSAYLLSHGKAFGTHVSNHASDRCPILCLTGVDAGVR
eukprot:6018516-Pyramimonas_sp.AAC.1